MNQIEQSQTKVYEFKQLEQVFFLWASATKTQTFIFETDAVNDEHFNREAA
jgi:hypothetical protein